MSELLDLSMYVVMRGDLEAPAGKLLVQAGHAFLGAFKVAGPVRQVHYSYPTRKVSLRIPGLDELLQLRDRCEALGLPHHLVTDEGRTVFETATTTCLGIGPLTKDEANKLNLRGLPKF